MPMLANELYGPRTPFSQWIHSTRHRGPEEAYDDYCVRFARTVARDSNERFYNTVRMLRNQMILPGGRQQVSVGRPYMMTALNCFVSGVIDDSISGIFTTLLNAARTMSAGGGIGYDFSSIRPEGDIVASLGGMGHAAGPVQFMRPFSEMCKVLVRSWARGAQMGCLRVDHPDILKFVNAKRDSEALSAFNLSALITDNFMEALSNDGLFDLKFNDRKYGQARAQDIWGPIMESNWDWAEPGAIFIDRINELNPLYYCEKIIATNPCGEQPLPAYGCCLLGSYNVVKFLVPHKDELPRLDESNPRITKLYQLTGGQAVTKYDLDWEQFDMAVELSVRAYDNVIDRTNYPLPEQEKEEKAKRRMGIGPVGMANALEIMGLPYGSPTYLDMQDKILSRAMNVAYKTSAQLAREKKKSFPLFDVEKYCEGAFFRGLDEDTQEDIVRKGLRNGLLTSIAPTGTIALDADNVSGGIEPVFDLKTVRTVDTVREGLKEFDLIDYAYNFYGVSGRTANELEPEDHISVLCRAQRYIDSSIAKTCNVNGQIAGQGPGVSFDRFEKLYTQAWDGGAKSCTTFNLNGKRMGILKSGSGSGSGSGSNAGPIDQQEEIACFIDPATGIRSCEA